jgi:hypothetical protein
MQSLRYPLLYPYSLCCTLRQSAPTRRTLQQQGLEFLDLLGIRRLEFLDLLGIRRLEVLELLGEVLDLLRRLALEGLDLRVLLAVADALVSSVRSTDGIRG